MPLPPKVPPLPSHIISAISDASIAEGADRAEVSRIVIDLAASGKRNVEITYAVPGRPETAASFSFPLNSILTQQELVSPIATLIDAALCDRLVLPDKNRVD